MDQTGRFPGWYVVGGAGFGIAFGSAVFLSSSFALLAAALGKQFGWSQSELAKAASIFLLMQMLTSPLCGWALDRWGSRKIAVLSIALFGISLFILSRIGPSLTQFYLGFVVLGGASVGTNVISYARAITNWFNRRRGLALGCAAAGQAVGAFTMPLVLQKVIATYGWSDALVALAAFELVICLPVVALLIKDSPRPYGLHPDGDVQGRQEAGTVTPAAPLRQAGASAREILRSANFWKLAIAFLVIGMSFYALITNVAFILTKSAGLTLGQVSTVLALSGVAVLVGRVGFGYLIDMIHAPYIAVLSLLLSVVFYALDATSTSFSILVIAAMIGGISIGGESDLLPFLASRYFGKDAVSQVFGWFLVAFYIGAAIGPVAFAKLSEAYNGPSVPLFVLVGLQIIPAIMFLSLGDYYSEPRELSTQPAA